MCSVVTADPKRLSRPCSAAYGMARTPGRSSTDGGSATLLAAAGAVLVAVATMVAAILLRYVAAAHELRGAADLVAVSAATAWREGGDACGAARRVALANHVTVEQCVIAGDAIEYVVTIRVGADTTAPWPGLPTHVQAVAHAGVVGR